MKTINISKNVIIIILGTLCVFMMVTTIYQRKCLISINRQLESNVTQEMENVKEHFKMWKDLTNLRIYQYETFSHKIDSLENLLHPPKRIHFGNKGVEKDLSVGIEVAPDDKSTFMDSSLYVNDSILKSGEYLSIDTALLKYPIYSNIKIGGYTSIRPYRMYLNIACGDTIAVFDDVEYVMECDSLGKHLEPINK